MDREFLLYEATRGSHKQPPVKNEQQFVYARTGIGATMFISKKER